MLLQRFTRRTGRAFGRQIGGVRQRLHHALQLRAIRTAAAAPPDSEANDGVVQPRKTWRSTQTEEPVARAAAVTPAVPPKELRVQWFPTRESDVDLLARRVLSAGKDLASDHPGFRDPTYRARRQAVADRIDGYRFGDSIPHVQYTAEETRTWQMVCDNLLPLAVRHACARHLRGLTALGISRDAIPQLQTVSDALRAATGFRLRPVTGLLSARDFLNGLAFRTFFSTQYIRHQTKPLYTPEPDVCHEVLGHAPLFADAEFADFSQQIGLASVGASDRDIERLGRCYWFTVEFGLCHESADGTANGVAERKAYGAGLLSSFGELKYAMGLDAAANPQPRYADFTAAAAAATAYPIETYQPLYFVTRSFAAATQQMTAFAQSLARPFTVRAATDAASSAITLSAVPVDPQQQLVMGSFADYELRERQKAEAKAAHKAAAAARTNAAVNRPVPVPAASSDANVHAVSTADTTAAVGDAYGVDVDDRDSVALRL